MSLVNPFVPNYPVGPGMFAGRVEMIQSIEQHLLQTRAGIPTNFMIIGERGIGKSSLLSYAKHMAQGETTLTGEKFNFLVLEADVSAETNQIDFVKRLKLNLENNLEKSEAIRSFIDDAWDFLQRIEFGSVSLKEKEAMDESQLIDQLAYSLEKTERRLCREEKAAGLLNVKFDGILILIDEADNASDSLNLGSLLKLLAERLQKIGSTHIMFGIAGLDELGDVLYKSHPSSLRIFDQIRLDKLNGNEMNEVISRALDLALHYNKIQAKITEEARLTLLDYSEGYPHFIQQFGYSAFAMDRDNNIEGSDVTMGAHGPNGAIAKIGERYYKGEYERITRESEKKILRIMADLPGDWVSKRRIQAKYRGSSSTFNSATNALVNSGIVVSHQIKKGNYKLRHKAFAFWLRQYERTMG